MSLRFLSILALSLAFLAGPLAAQDRPAPKVEAAPAKAGPPTEVTPTGLVDVPDPTDGGTYHVRPELAAAVRAHVAAKQQGGPKAMPAGPGVGPSASVGDQGELAEVNALRAQRGMPPYQYDAALAQAATAAATARARSGTQGHTPNDFAFLPPGAHASSAGCAAWPVGMGWGSCSIYENCQYAGAGSCVGADGRRYMHLFVR